MLVIQLTQQEKKIGLPVFTENKQSFTGHEMTYNFKTKKM